MSIFFSSFILQQHFVKTKQVFHQTYRLVSFRPAKWIPPTQRLYFPSYQKLYQWQKKHNNISRWKIASITYMSLHGICIYGKVASLSLWACLPKRTSLSYAYSYKEPFAAQHFWWLSLLEWWLCSHRTGGSAAQEYSFHLIALFLVFRSARLFEISHLPSNR